MNNHPENNRAGGNQLPRPGYTSGGNRAPQNGYPSGQVPQNGAVRNNGQQSYPQQGYPQQGYPQNGNPQNAYGRSGYPQAPAYGPNGGTRQGSYNPGQNAPRNGQNGAYPGGGNPQANPQSRQGGAYPYNRPVSATSAAYGANQPSGSAAGRRQRDAMVNRQAAAAMQRREKPRRVKRPFRFNWGVAVFLLLCATVIGVSVWQVNRAGWNENGIAMPAGPVTNAEPKSQNPADAPEAGELGTENEAEPSGLPGTDAAGQGETQTGDQTGDHLVLTPDEPADPGTADEVLNLTLYDTVSVDNARLSEGDLILVNASHGYSGGDAFVDQLKNAYRDRTGKLKVAATDIGLLPVAFDALERLVVDFEEDTGSHDLLITSGHRTVAEQQEVWDYYLNQNGEDYANAYVAKPGYSEHNTGLACDVSFYTDDGASIPVSEYEHGWWLAANCAREGFIRRYPDDKVEITGIANEPWHFRYVGIPHARICSSRNWCLEEYIEGVKAYSADGVLLFVGADGTVSEVNAADGLPTSGGWLVYYVPKASAGGVTEVRVPRGSDYTISGNNADGFIVTVDLR